MSAYNSYITYPILWNRRFPSHWEVLPLYAVAQEKSICDCVDLPLLSVYLDVGVIPFSAKAEKRTNATSKDLSKYQRVDCGDFVLNNQQAWRGSVGISFNTGIVSPAYIVLLMNDRLDSKYANYLLRSRIMVDQYLINSRSVGSIQRNIYWPSLKRTSVIVPPRAEQDQIVRYLDWQVSKINRLITAKKKEIKTLKEYQEAEIERQLASFPATAEIRLKQLGTFEKGGGFSRENLVDEDNGCPAILYGDIYTQYRYSTDIITHHIDRVAYESSTKIKHGMIVLSGTGETKDEIGKPILYNGNETVAAGGDVIIFKPLDGVNSEYILFQLYSRRSLAFRYVNGKGDIIVHIYPKNLGNSVVSMIDEEKQSVVVERIKETIKKVDAATQKLKQDIEVLHELRTQLVSDVVTGQIDVRGIEVPDFEYVGEDADGESEENVVSSEGEQDEE